MAPKTPDIGQLSTEFASIQEASLKIQDTISKITKELDEQKKVAQDINNIEEEKKKGYEEQLKNVSDLVKKKIEEANNLERQKALVEESIEQIARKNDMIQKAVEAQDAEAVKLSLQYSKEQEFLKEKQKFIDKYLESLKEELEKDQKKYEILEKTHKIYDKTSSIVTALTGIRKDAWDNSFLGQFGSVSFSNAIVAVGRGIKDTLTISNIFAGTFQKMQESTMQNVYAQDQVLSSFQKSTGTLGQYNDMIIDLGRDNRAAGIDIHEAAAAIQTLRESVTAYSEMSMKAQGDMALMTATMAELGVASSITAGNIEISTKQLGLSTEQAVKAQKEIFATAKALGLSPQKMASDFQNAGPRLAAFGDKAIEKFRELEVVSKATGMSTNSLLDVVAKFDTFEGAADAVGNLNSILGGNLLDSMDMVRTTDPTERFKKLREAVTNAGLSFDTMSYYQRKSIAANMGLKDVGELSQLMTGDLEKNSAAAKENAASQAEMAKMAGKVQSIGDQVKQMFMALSISMQPVINIVKEIVNGFLSLNDLMGGSLIPILTALIGVWAIYSKIIAPIRAAKQAMAVTTAILATAENTAAIAKAASNAADQASTPIKMESVVATKAQATATTTAIGPTLAFGAAALMVGVGVALAALGLAQLAKAMSSMSGAQIFGLVLIMGIMAGVVLILAGASLTAVGPMWALGGAFLMIGAGIALMGVGISLSMNSFSGFFSTLLGVAIIIPLAAVSITLLSVSLMALAGSLFFINEDKFSSLAVILQSISKLSSESTNSLKGVAATIREIAKAIDTIPEEKMATFTYAVNAITSSPQVGTEITKNVTQLSEQAINYKNTVVTSKTEAMQPMSQIANALSQGGSSSGTAGSVNEKPIILQLDGRVLSKYIIDIMNNQLVPRKT